MNDLTILYYTANRLDNNVANRVRQYLLEVAKDIPIISISHEPLDFGHNIHVGYLDYGTYSIYKQILIGAMCARTKYVVCCEDDAIYPEEHFLYRPRESTFEYNINKWWVNEDIFFHSRVPNMIGCIAETELMVETLCKRFAKYPHELTPTELDGWGEPGRKEDVIGIDKPSMDKFRTVSPIFALNHDSGSGGKRHLEPKHRVARRLDGFGTAKEIWDKFYG